MGAKVIDDPELYVVTFDRSGDVGGLRDFFHALTLRLAHAIVSGTVSDFGNYFKML